MPVPRMMKVWPAVLVAGVSFAIPQFLLSNFHGPSLVDVISSMCFSRSGNSLPDDMASQGDLGLNGMTPLPKPVPSMDTQQRK